MSISMPSFVSLLTFSCVALICVALFHKTSPLPGSPDVAVVSAKYSKIVDEMPGIPEVPLIPDVPL